MKALLLALAACTEPMPIDDMTCPPEGTLLTYDNFGADFMASHCNSCHSTGKSGAPRAYRFDTQDEVLAHKDRIFVRAAGPNLTMPPGPNDPPQAARDQLAEWLACGAP
ncbi:MAG: cytochrome c [Deltaproteobacteria bacterium]|nr:cytochrome c [Deltaproteobacteria bacterium]